KAWAGKGSVLKFMQRYEEAIQSLEKFIELAPPELAAQNQQAWTMIFDLKLLLKKNEE
ncbi:MAG: tetratricopeptide repeat protein, partial [Methanobacterium sp.]